MAAHLQPCIVLYLLLLVIISAIIQSSCQSISPQNIEAFYPFSLPPLFPPSNSSTHPVSSPPAPTGFLESPPPALPPAAQEQSSSSKKAVGTAIGITAATTLVVSGLLFCLLVRYMRRRKKDGDSPQISNPVVLPPNEFVRFNGNLKGMIIDENGLDVLYWKRLEGQDSKNGFKKQIVKYAKSEEKEEEKRIIGRKSGLHIQEIPLLKGESSTSQSPVRTHMEDANHNKASIPARANLKAMGKQPLTVLPEIDSPLQKTSPIPQPPPPPPPKVQAPTPPPPPPIPPKKSPAPPPPPPLKTGGLLSSLKPPAPKGIQSDNEQGPSSSGDGASGTGDGQVKFKPLHWDKVNANLDHSMVWTKLEGGSFKVDDDLMEALFGYVATNKKSPEKRSNSSTPKGNKYSPPSQIFILDTRKSQNIAIVLRSLAITREEIIGALTDGHSLDTDTLEKLNRIAPTKEEESDILAFDGDIRRLADAESFLFHILKAVPSAFLRFNAMLFRSNYDSELSPFKEALQTLESACKELRARGIFLKLLEAILKAGNRMNAGTARGNAQAFNLTALRKLSDVKSIDGKTTLLHFVVEEVVRAEGKRCVLNRNHSFSRSNSRNSSSSSQVPDTSLSRDEREKEYIMLGLPVVGGLSVEFSNVKKAATIDYDTFAKTCSALTSRVTEIRKLVAQCGDDGERFAREMKRFLDAAEEEIKLMSEEQTRVMELVKRTTDYYQAGASKDKDAYHLQLFVIVKDFLAMVDQACVDIARNMQKRKSAAAGAGLSQRSPNTRAVKFPVLPPNFLSDSSKSNSSDSGDDS